MFDRFRLWNQQWFNDNEVEKSHKNHTFFPNSVTLGVSGHCKGFLSKVQEVPKDSQEEVPKQGSQRFRFTKVPKSGFPSNLPKQGSQRFRFTKVPKSGFPSNLPKQGSQRFPSKASKVARNRIYRFPKVPERRSPKIPKGSQEQVPKSMFPRAGFQARFPGRGSQRFPVLKTTENYVKEW